MNRATRLKNALSGYELAKDYEREVEKLHDRGYPELLQALKDGVIALPELLSADGGPQELKKLVDKRVRVEHGSTLQFSGLIDMFESARKSELKPKTIKGYVTHARRFDEFITDREGRPTHLDDLRRVNILVWRDELIEELAPPGTPEDVRQQKERTVNRHLNGVGSVCTWLMDVPQMERLARDNELIRAIVYEHGEKNPQGLLSANPTSGLRFKGDSGRKAGYTYFQPSQLASFLKASREYDLRHPPQLAATAYTLWWRMLAATGATTLTEGAWITRGDIHVDHVSPHGTVKVHIAGRKSVYRERDVWIPHNLALDLEDHADHFGLGLEDRLFPFDHHRQYLDRWGEIMEAVKNIRVRELTPYALRHTYAVQMLKGNPEKGVPGADLGTLQRLMGHNNLSTTEMYASHRGEGAALFSAVSAGALGLDDREGAGR